MYEYIWGETQKERDKHTDQPLGTDQTDELSSADSDKKKNSRHANKIS